MAPHGQCRPAVVGELDTLGSFLKSCGFSTKSWTHMLAGQCSWSGDPGLQGASEPQPPCLECQRSQASPEMSLLTLSFHLGWGRQLGGLSREGQEYGVKGNGPLISVLPGAMGTVGDGLR